jgi:flavin-dependent dehydrogenase
LNYNEIRTTLFGNIQHYINNKSSKVKTPRKRGVVVVGGGLAGLIAAILLARKGVQVTLVERKSYPFHRVCGEYISNETRPFLLREQLFPGEFSPPEIRELQLTSTNGRSALVALDPGGFCISRFTFDHFLYKKALDSGVRFLLDTEVTNVVAVGEAEFEVQAGTTALVADVVLAAHGKRSRIDHALKRSFITKRSPYAGIKYHVRVDFPASRIALHNFSGGYCGVCRVEDGVSNFCYLTRTENLRQHKTISAMEEAVLFRNPFIREIFNRAEFVFEKPEVINEISFETKCAVEQHVLVAGDAAGMITPLCGNGMAMAIRSAGIASRWIMPFMDGETDRKTMEQGYAREWNQLFARRLWIGRQVQHLFGEELASNIAVNIARNSHRLTRWLVRSTHGEVF